MRHPGAMRNVLSVLGFVYGMIGLGLKFEQRFWWMPSDIFWILWITHAGLIYPIVVYQVYLFLSNLLGRITDVGSST